METLRNNKYSHLRSWYQWVIRIYVMICIEGYCGYEWMDPECCGAVCGGGARPVDPDPVPGGGGLLPSGSGPAAARRSAAEPRSWTPSCWRRSGDRDRGTSLCSRRRTWTHTRTSPPDAAPTPPEGGGGGGEEGGGGAVRLQTGIHQLDQFRHFLHWFLNKVTSEDLSEDEEFEVTWINLQCEQMFHHNHNWGGGGAKESR